MPLTDQPPLPRTAVSSAAAASPPIHPPGLQYRPDLDGLRAVAVLSVIAFHAGFGCPGGYVGVDVFFVLSGFLIGSIVREKVVRGNFSIVDFWERRVRRLAAALVAVIGFGIVAAWWILLPGDFTELGQSIVAQSLFAANVYFWREAGYFAGPSELKPLLHLWSLAVEEQFYFVLPPLLVALQRARGRVPLAVLSGLALASFGWSAWSTQRWPDAAFFLLPARAWELLLGVLATFVVDAVRTRVPRRVADIAAGLGLAAIIIAVATYSRLTPFPGIAAALPCLGAVAVILGNSPGSTFVGRVLSWKPCVLIGVISYSLYLWHWPLLSFLAYLTVGPPSFLARSVCVAAAFALAAGSYRFVEQPIRSGHALASRRRLFAAAGVSLIVLTACGSVLHVSRGFRSRFSPQVLAFLNAPGPDRNLRARTVRESAADMRAQGFGSVYPTKPGRSPVLALLGDSHGDALLPVVEQMSREFDVPTIAATRVASLPLLSPESESNPDKREFQQLTFDALMNSGVRHVLLVGRWSAFGDDLTADSCTRTFELLREHGIQVWILRQVPEQRDDVPRSLALAEHWGWDATAVSTTLGEYNAAQRHADAVLNAAVSEDDQILDSTAVFFSESDCCRVQAQGHPLYYDDDHLAKAGALELFTTLGPLYSAILASRAPVSH